jgi:hypothetical protein
VLELLAGRADEHVAHEERMVGTGAHDAHADPVPLIPAGVSVNDVDAAPGVEVVDGTLAVDFPDLDVASRVSGVICLTKEGEGEGDAAGLVACSTHRLLGLEAGGDAWGAGGRHGTEAGTQSKLARYDDSDQGGSKVGGSSRKGKGEKKKRRQ